jgi:transcriptional regulator with XRE-family HTH domain
MVDLRPEDARVSVVILWPEQCRAARGLLNWSQDHLATVSGVSRSTIKDFESHRHALQRSTEALLIQALEVGGVRLIGPGDGGPGVRLRTTPQGQGE